MRSLLTLMQAAADETRLRLLMALRHQELCVCQLQALLHLAPSTVSAHLRLLTQAGLIERRREGKWVYVRLAREETTPAVHDLLRLIRRDPQNCPRIARDEKALQDVLSLTPSELCPARKPPRPTRARRTR